MRVGSGNIAAQSKPRKDNRRPCAALARGRIRVHDEQAHGEKDGDNGDRVKEPHVGARARRGGFRGTGLDTFPRRPPRSPRPPPFPPVAAARFDQVAGAGYVQHERTDRRTTELPQSSGPLPFMWRRNIGLAVRLFLFHFLFDEAVRAKNADPATGTEPRRV